MKWIFASAAALLLASCDTMDVPPAGPYGQPAPYPGDPYPGGAPYPGDPYPGGAPYPPGGSPGAPYAPTGPIDACPIESSRDWRASVTAPLGPGSRPMLVIAGTVVAPTGGYRMEFVPNLTVMRSYPVQVIARLLPIPPQGPATQALVTHDVRWQWPLTGPVGSVAIRCGTETLARIAPVGGG